MGKVNVEVDYIKYKGRCEGRYGVVECANKAVGWVYNTGTGFDQLKKVCIDCAKTKPVYWSFTEGKMYYDTGPYSNPIRRLLVTLEIKVV